MRRDSRPPGASAHRPGYAAGQYYQPGHDIAGWVAEDQRLSAAEAAAILDTDVEPAVASLGAPAPPVIIGGDFNSGSDQDWTAAAARWHGGYGPVPLPTSRLMRERGFGDAFRGLHPDEVARPEGTFAAIYGHLQHSRIDCIYHRGQGIRPVAAKIVRTPPDPVSETSTPSPTGFGSRWVVAHGVSAARSQRRHGLTPIRMVSRRRRESRPRRRRRAGRVPIRSRKAVA